jgi:hypothetical protein
MPSATTQHTSLAVCNPNHPKRPPQGRISEELSKLEEMDALAMKVAVASTEPGKKAKGHEKHK